MPRVQRSRSGGTWRTATCQEGSHNIRSALQLHANLSGDIFIQAFGDTKLLLDHKTQEALSTTGITLNHVPRGSKDTADKAILAAMLFWALDNPPPAHFLLISGDVDFANTLHRLRNKRYNVLLARPDQNVKPALLGAASNVWYWTDLASGKLSVTHAKGNLSSQNLISTVKYSVSGSLMSQGITSDSLKSSSSLLLVHSVSSASPIVHSTLSESPSKDTIVQRISNDSSHFQKGNVDWNALEGLCSHNLAGLPLCQDVVVHEHHAFCQNQLMERPFGSSDDVAIVSAEQRNLTSMYSSLPTEKSYVTNARLGRLYSSSEMQRNKSVKSLTVRGTCGSLESGLDSSATVGKRVQKAPFVFGARRSLDGELVQSQFQNVLAPAGSTLSQLLPAATGDQKPLSLLGARPNSDSEIIQTQASVAVETLVDTSSQKIPSLAIIPSPNGEILQTQSESGLIRASLTLSQALPAEADDQKPPFVDAKPRVDGQMMQNQSQNLLLKVSAKGQNAPFPSPVGKNVPSFLSPKPSFHGEITQIQSQHLSKQASLNSSDVVLEDKEDEKLPSLLLSKHSFDSKMIKGRSQDLSIQTSSPLSQSLPAKKPVQDCEDQHSLQFHSEKPLKQRSLTLSQLLTAENPRKEYCDPHRFQHHSQTPTTQASLTLFQSLPAEKPVQVFQDSYNLHINIVYKAMETLKQNMLPPTEPNLRDCIFCLEKRVTTFNLSQTLAMGMKKGELTETRGLAGGLQMFLPTSSKMWNFVDDGNMVYGYNNDVWTCFRQFLLSSGGQQLIKGSKNRYHAAQIFRGNGPDRIQHLLLGHVVNVIQQGIQLRRWLFPCPLNWSPVHINVITLTDNLICELESSKVEKVSPFQMNVLTDHESQLKGLGTNSLQGGSLDNEIAMQSFRLWLTQTLKVEKGYDISVVHKKFHQETGILLGYAKLRSLIQELSDIIRLETPGKGILLLFLNEGVKRKPLLSINRIPPTMPGTRSKHA